MKSLIAASLLVPFTVQAAVYCKNLDVSYDVKGSNVIVYGINTNLPGNTIIEIHVKGRIEGAENQYETTFYQKGKYLDKWQEAETFNLGSARRKFKTSNDGTPATEIISLEVVVPSGQTNSKFGRTNQYLSGCGVTQIGGRFEISKEWDIARQEVKIAKVTPPPPPAAPRQPTATELAVRKEKIEKQFSAWDGSHIKLERYIENVMKDPDSYDHVKTVYWDRGDYLVVQTTFRGKNSFGAVVINSVKAKVSLDGDILAILND